MLSFDGQGLLYVAIGVVHSLVMTSIIYGFHKMSVEKERRCGSFLFALLGGLGFYFLGACVMLVWVAFGGQYFLVWYVLSTLSALGAFLFLRRSFYARNTGESA